MPIEAILAAASFIGLFTAWVILPSRLRRRHLAKTEENDNTST